MMSRFGPFRLLAAFAVLVVLGSTPDACAAEKKKLLVITQSAGFRHGPVTLKEGESLTLVGRTLEEIGEKSGLFEVEESQKSDAVITAENLRRFDAILFYTTGILPLSDEQKEALLNFVKSGKGFIGVHSATDTFKQFPGYYEMINGSFAGHPWGAGTMVTITNHEKSHPTVAMFDDEFKFKDEIYQYSNYDPMAVRVLLSLKMAKNQTKRPYHVPVCWVRDYGKGRLFYTNLGHNKETWVNPKFREHLLQGFRWATGMEKKGRGDSNPVVQAVEHVQGFVATVGPEVGGNVEALMAAVARLPMENPLHLRHLAEHVDEFKSLYDKKGSAERKEALEEILGEIE